MDDFKNTDNPFENDTEKNGESAPAEDSFENTAAENAGGEDTPNSPPPFGQGDFSHTGEYRYAPPYSDKNARDSVYGTSRKADYTNSSTSSYSKDVPPSDSFSSSPAPEKKKKEKKVRTFSTAALALIIAGCVLLSFAAGMCGALFITGGFKQKEESSLQNSLVGNNANGTASKFEGSYDISDVSSVVSASVVEVTTEFNKTMYGQYHYVQEGAGSGVIISADGYILTNAHVITDSESGKLADAVTIRLNNSSEYEAKIIGSDQSSDIALLKIEATELTFATPGNSDSIKVGEQIIAVGNPLGELGGTVTCGIISATNREITVEDNKMTLIQIDAAINPGNSGGGLFNVKGELIGIVNAKTTDIGIEGLGFAIPVNEAMSVAQELDDHGYVKGRSHIGISLVDVTDSFTALYYFDSESTGVYISYVQEGYNDTVLKYGDRITAINDNEVSTSADVKEIISESEVGDVLVFTVSRGRKLHDVEVTCYEYVPEEGVSFEEE